MNKTIITKAVTVAGNVFTANSELALQALMSDGGMIVKDDTGAFRYINGECCPVVSVAETTTTVPVVLNPIVC